jgi:flagellar basal body rod protein FlgG
VLLRAARCLKRATTREIAEFAGVGRTMCADRLPAEGSAPDIGRMSLSSLLSIGASGVRDAYQRLDVSAHNVANVNTPDYKARRADGVEIGEVRLEREIVEQIAAKHAVSANVAVIRTAGDVHGELLDLIG